MKQQSSSSIRYFQSSKLHKLPDVILSENPKGSNFGIIYNGKHNLDVGAEIFSISKPLCEMKSEMYIRISDADDAKRSQNLDYWKSIVKSVANLHSIVQMTELFVQKQITETDFLAQEEKEDVKIKLKIIELLSSFSLTPPSSTGQKRKYLSPPQDFTTTTSPAVTLELIAERFAKAVFYVTPDTLALYPVPAALLRHSCEANGSYEVSFDGALIIRAIRDILPGEEITVSKQSVRFSNKNKRQDILRATQGLLGCTCSACLEDRDLDLQAKIQWTPLEEDIWRFWTFNKCSSKEEFLPLQSQQQQLQKWSNLLLVGDKKTKILELQAMLFKPLYCHSCGYYGYGDVRLKPCGGKCGIFWFCNAKCQKESKHTKKQCNDAKQLCLTKRFLFPPVPFLQSSSSSS